jgi:HEAT repeat protein
VIRTDPAGPIYLETVISAGPVMVPALADLVGSSDLTERWVGVAALGRLVHVATGADLERARSALNAVLHDGDSTIAAYAAGGLAGIGDAAGLGELASVLLSPDTLRYSEPPDDIAG